MAYEIVSDVDNGKIAATIKIPTRKVPKTVLVRFRHPTKQAHQERDRQRRSMDRLRSRKEVIRLHDVHGSVKVEAAY